MQKIINLLEDFYLRCRVFFEEKFFVFVDKLRSIDVINFFFVAKEKICAFFTKKISCCIMDQTAVTTTLKCLEEYKKTFISVHKWVEIKKTTILVDGILVQYGYNMNDLMDKIESINDVIYKIEKASKCINVIKYACIFFSNEDKENLIMAGSKINRVIAGRNKKTFGDF